MKKASLFAFFFALGLVAAFQNCSPTLFKNQESENTASSVAPVNCSQLEIRELDDLIPGSQFRLEAYLIPETTDASPYHVVWQSELFVLANYGGGDFKISVYPDSNPFMIKATLLDAANQVVAECEKKLPTKIFHDGYED